jgi:hypothetical protein
MDEPATSGAFDTRAGFIAAVQQSLDAALAQRARCMVWVDADFAGWPVDDGALLQRLAGWLRLPQRRLLMLAAEPEALRQRPRFMALYRWWSHALEVRAVADEDAAQLPCLLLVQGSTLVQVHDKLRWRGGWLADPPALRAALDRVDALAQRAMPALPVSTLGL